MRMNVMDGLFRRPVVFETSEDGERTMCKACGSFVFDQRAHRDFHAALRQVARDADRAEARAGR